MKSLSLSQPHLIIMVGVPGSGKTFFAEKFADTFHAPYVSHEKLLTLIGDPTVYIDDLFYHQLGELLKTRQSILLEGVAETRAQRLELARLARSAGYETILIWVQTEPATAKSRYQREKKLNRATSPEEYDKLVQRFAQPTAIEKPVVISGKHTYATQAKIILKKLSEPRAEISKHITPPTRAESPEPSSRRRNITIR
jgi:predicted kinase